MMLDEYTDVYQGGPLDEYTDLYPGDTTPLPDLNVLPVFPSVRSSTATTHSSATAGVTSETVDRPALVEAGDLLVLYTVMDAGTLADLTVPAGFTQLGELGTGTNNPVGSVAYKVATGTEPATYTYGRFSADSDGASLMVAVRDWDGDTANLRYAQQETTRTARAVPAVTPATARGLVLTSAHHDATAAATWGWVAPGQGLLAGVAHNAGGWSSVGVASQPHTSTDPVTGLDWAGSRTSSTVTPMVTTALTVGAGTATVETQIGPTSGGAGGPHTDQTNLSFSSGGLTHTYHRYAAGLDWDKPVGLLIWTDGSAEFGLVNPTSAYLLAGANGLIAVAKRHNMVLLTPMAPGGPCDDGDGVCWYDTSGGTGTTATQKLAWSNALITHILGQYNIDKSRLAAGGYSSGAQWTARFWGPGHAHDTMTDGVLVPVSYGGTPLVANTNTDEFKTNVAMHWNTGETDSATSTSTWGSLGGHDHYATNGYQTTLTIVGGTGHNRYVSGPSEGEFGRIMHDAITRHVRPAVHIDLTETHTGVGVLAGTGTITGTAPFATDDFNRATGPLGRDWVTEPAGSVTISDNQAVSDVWEARALRDIHMAHGYRVSTVINRREWPILLFRYADGYAGWYGVAWSNPSIELVRQIDGEMTVLASMPSPTQEGLTVWAEVRETAGGTEFRWGHGLDSSTFVDDLEGRPAGTKVGFQTHPGRTFDDFTVTPLAAITTPGEEVVLSATGTLTGSATARIAQSTVLAADGVLTATGNSTQSGAATATLTATGTLTGTTVASVTEGAGVIGADGTLTGTGVAAMAGQGAGLLQGTGTLTGTGAGSSAGTGQATLTATGALTATGTGTGTTPPLPPTGRIVYTIDGVPLDDPTGRWWVSDRTGETHAPALELHTLNVMAGQIGEIDALSPSYGAAVWPLVMGIRGADYAQAKAFKDELDRFLLGRHGLATIIEAGPDGSKLCQGIVAGGTEVERFDSGFRLDVAYPVRIPAGRWFDAEERSVTLGPGNRIGGDISDGTYQLGPLLGGSRDMDITIATIGNGSNTDVRITDVASGQWVRIAGSIILGTPITIDPKTLTATAGGNPASGLLDFSPRDLYLSPAATVRVQQNGAQPVTIRARRAYA